MSRSSRGKQRLSVKISPQLLREARMREQDGRWLGSAGPAALGRFVRKICGCEEQKSSRLKPYNGRIIRKTRPVDTRDGSNNKVREAHPRSIGRASLETGRGRKPALEPHIAPWSTSSSRRRLVTIFHSFNVDSGADVSLAPRQLAECIGLTWLRGSKVKLSGISPYQSVQSKAEPTGSLRSSLT